jgi:hypothetical protein
MIASTDIVLASFTTPLQIDTTPGSLLWLLPLVAAVAVVYKATKVGKVRALSFARESAVLFGSIIAFIVVAALMLYCMAWFFNEQLPDMVRRFSL